MAYDPVTTYATGASNTFNVPWAYLDTSHVVVTKNGIAQAEGLHFEFITAGQIQFLMEPEEFLPAGTEVTIERATPYSPLVTINPGPLNPKDLNDGFKQPLYGLEELEAETERSLQELRQDLSAAVLGGGGQAFKTTVEAMAYVVPEGDEPPSFVRTEGYASVGDYGGAAWLHVVAEPGHGGKFSMALEEGGSAWYSLVEPEVRPEMFGASRSRATLSTSALLAMSSYVNVYGTPVKLSAIYRSASTLAFTCNGLVVQGTTSQTSGFAFDGCDGITLDHSATASPTTRYRLENFCILTTGQMLYKGFYYTGTDSGGGGMTLREIKGLHLCGEGYFDNNGVTGIESLPAAQRNAGWLVGIDLQYSDNTCVSNCRIHGSWQSYANSNPITNPKFPVETFGVRSEGSTGLYCTDVQVFFLRHGFRVFGSCENVKIVDCVAVACWKGVTITGLTGAANYIQVIRTHAAVWEWGINIDTAMMHVVRDNLIFSMGDQDYYGILFRGIVFGGFRSIISGNHIYSDPADDPSLNVDVAMDITSNVNIISENHFQHFDNLLRISGSTNTAVNNTSSQSVNIGTVLPVEDTGAGNMFANNAGDQSGYWPAIRIQTKTVATLTAESKNVGKIAVCSDEAGGTTIVFADGTNWRRVQDRAVMS